MKRFVATLTFGLLLLATMTTAAGARTDLASRATTIRDAAVALPVISKLDYTSKPLYDDDGTIVVTFRASRPARAGYEYSIVILIDGEFRDCAFIADSTNRDFGGNPGLHMRTAGKHSRLLSAGFWGHWCRGTADMGVVEHKIGSSDGGRVLGKGSSLRFRVFSAP